MQFFCCPLVTGFMFIIYLIFFVLKNYITNPSLEFEKIAVISTKETEKFINENEVFHLLFTWIIITIFLLSSGISIGIVKIIKN